MPGLLLLLNYPIGLLLKALNIVPPGTPIFHIRYGIACLIKNKLSPAPPITKRNEDSLEILSLRKSQPSYTIRENRISDSLAHAIANSPLGNQILRQ